MKRVVEEIGVEVRERTVVTRITPGKINHVDTECWTQEFARIIWPNCQMDDEKL
jgi:hypothetical protein